MAILTTTNQGLNFIGGTTFIQTGTTTLMAIATNGNIQFSQYGAGTLVTDASGNITVSSGGGAGGPYLPVANPTFTGALTGPYADLEYIKLTAANPGILMKETDITDKNWDIQVNSGNLKFYEVNDARSVFSEKVTFEAGGNVGIGETSPQAKLDIYDTFTKTAANPNTVEVFHTGSVSTNNIYPVAGLFTQRVSGSANVYATGLVGVADKLGDYGYLARGVQGIGKLSGNITVNNADMQYMGVEGRIEMEGSNSVNLDDRGYSFYGTAEIDSGSHLKEYHGLYLNTPTNNGTILNKYGVSQVDANSKNYFAGNVGIGTTSPGYKLEVGLTSSVALASQPAIPLMISNDGNSVDGRVLLQVKHDAVNTAGAIAAGYQMTAAAVTSGTASYYNSLIFLESAQSGSETVHSAPKNIEFYTNNSAGAAGSGASYQELGNLALELQADGDAIFYDNVGIGTTSPEAKLQIDNPGQGEFAGGNSSTAGGSHLMLKDEGSTSRTLMSGPSVVFQTPANSDGTNLWATSRLLGSPAAAGSARGTFSIQVRDQYDPLSDGTSWNWRTALTAINTGNVGIGTTSPTQAKLVVSGNVAFNQGDETMGQINPEFERLDFKVSDGVVSATPVAMTLRDYANGPRLGIGTTTPSAKLDIQGTQGQLFSVTDDLSGSIFAVADISGVPIFDVNSSGVSYFDGNVGIGTASPGAKLEVYGSSPNILISNTAETDSGIVFTDAQAGTSQRAAIKFNSSDNKLKFFVNDEVAQRMVIDTSGNVGIGETNPATTLDVLGTYRQINPAAGAAGGTVIARTLTYSASPYGLVTRGYNNGLFTIQCERESNAGENFDMALQPTGGNVGIGITGPLAKLHVNQGTASGTVIKASGIQAQIEIQTSTAGDAHLYMRPNSTGNNAAIFKMTAGTNYNWRWQDDATTPVVFMQLSQSNSSLSVKGDVIAYGSPSDERYKENIKPIESALDKVTKLQGVTFDWKESDNLLDIKEDIGFIAQDVQKVVPELVRENEDGKLSLRYQGITPILLEAIKELKAEIEELKKQIK